jgi:predicted phage terminase large subunit-like protein
MTEANPRWQYAGHIRELQRIVINTLFSDVKNRVAVSVACRHGKSWFASMALPAWYLLNYPERNVILATHSLRFTEHFTSQVRSLIERFGDKDACLDPRYKSRSDMRMLQGGGLVGVGAGGGITGRGCDLLVLDDLVSDQKEALSPSARESQKQWLFADALTRLEPNGKVIAVLSRRHEQDVVGAALASNENLDPQDMWTEYKLPAIRTDAEGHQHALWPERFPLEKLLRIKKELESTGQSYIWQSLYQQVPTDPTSLEWPESYFENILSTNVKSNGVKILCIDPSKSKAGDGDCAALLILNINKDLTVDVIDGAVYQMPIQNIVELATRFIIEHNIRICSVETTDWQHLILSLIEQELVKNKRIHSVKLLEYKPTVNKIARCKELLSPMLAKGRIKINNIPALKPLLEQCRLFPTHRFDDGVDALAQGIHVAAKYMC